MFVTQDLNLVELRRIDLNLLVVFAAVAEERSVQRAARRLSLGPSAVSMALGRLRDLFGDRLFVRGRAGLELTPRANGLQERLGPILTALRGAVTETVAFDPARAERTIRFASPDDLELVLLPRLLAAVRREAPGITLVVRPSDFRVAPALLDADEVDLALTASPVPIDPRHRREVLLDEGFVVLHDPAQVTGPFDLAGYLATPQVVVSATGTPSGTIDHGLAALGYSRRVVAAVAHFSTLPFVLRSSAVIANVPRTSAVHFARAFGLATAPLPFVSPRFDVALLWHGRRDADPAVRWLRDLVRELVHEIGSSTPSEPHERG